MVLSSTIHELEYTEGRFPETCSSYLHLATELASRAMVGLRWGSDEMRPIVWGQDPCAPIMGRGVRGGNVKLSQARELKGRRYFTPPES